jgi:hypothetical protein
MPNAQPQSIDARLTCFQAGSSMSCCCVMLLLLEAARGETHRLMARALARPIQCVNHFFVSARRGGGGSLIPHRPPPDQLRSVP